MQGREGKEGEEEELGKWGVGEREGGRKEEKERWQGAACVVAPVMASGRVRRRLSPLPWSGKLVHGVPGGRP